MFANAVYAAAYTIELNAPDLQTAVFWLKAEHFGVMLVPAFWYLVAERLAGRRSTAGRFRTASLFAMPITTIALTLTTEAHGLMYSGYRLADVPGLTVLICERGWWYWMNAAYQYILVAVGSYRIARKLFMASGVFRAQAFILAAGVLCPWLAHIALLFRKGPWSLDPTPFALTVTGVTMVVGIFRLKLFDLVPIARDRVFDVIRDGVVVIDDQSRFVDANAAAKNAFPAVAALRPGDDAAPFLSMLPPSSGRAAGAAEVSLIVGGAVRHFRIDATEIRNASGSPDGQAIILADTTETTELLSKLARLATTDELTGAYNRRHFFELGEREMNLARRSDRPLSFAMFDLDLFKDVNDRRGHPAGDAALRKVCETCRAVLRSSDMLCRYGGEEFVILFPDATPRAAAEIAERLRSAIASSIVEFGGENFSVTASFGVAGAETGPAGEIADYLKRVDEALYRAKQAGRNRVELA